MSGITLNQHRAATFQEIVAVFSDDKAPFEALQMFFPVQISTAGQFSIEVERNLQMIAVDVSRYDAVRNVFDISTEKIFKPPYFNEFFDFTSLDRYDVTFSAMTSGGQPNVYDMRQLIKSGATKALKLKNKIARKKELMRAQVLQTGIVTMVNGISIDFKRQAGSFITKTSTATWDNATTCKPLADLVAGAQFVRDEGKSIGNVFRAILGQNAATNFEASTQVQNEGKQYNNVERSTIGMPELDKTSGMTFIRRIGSGDFIFDLFTYSATYDDPTTGAKTPYIDTNNVIVMPTDFVGVTQHGGVPSIMGTPETGQVIAPQAGDYYMRDVIDPVKLTWCYYVSSLVVPIPISVDRIATIITIS